FSFMQMPGFIKKEIEKLEETLSPFLKKVNRYAFWAFPLIAISLFNLFFMFFVSPADPNIISLVIFAVIGAAGFALAKEAKVRRKEIEKISADYMIKRIQSSTTAPEHVKTTYISEIEKHPRKAMVHFITFLKVENSME